jgi:AraC-like DNA-binding protein
MNSNTRYTNEIIEVLCDSAQNFFTEGCTERCELIAVYRGEGELSVEGERIPLRRGSVAVIRRSCYRKILSQGELAVRRVTFSEEDISEKLFISLGLAEGWGCAYLSEKAMPHVISAIDRFSLAGDIPENLRADFSRAVLSELLITVSSLSGEEVAPREYGLGARVASYINENLTSDLSLEHIAKTFFVSKYYLCRAFKRHTGIGVHSYVTAKRISLAKEMIASGEVASAVAYKVGFGDYSAFYRAYVKQVGKAPTDK